MLTKSTESTAKIPQKAEAARSQISILLTAAVGLGVLLVGVILVVLLARMMSGGTSAAAVPPTLTRPAQPPATAILPPQPASGSTSGGLTVSSTPPPGWTDIKAEELKQKIESGADILIIDVRSKEQYAQGHIKSAISLPLADLEQQYKDVVPHDKEVVLYCAGGT